MDLEEEEERFDIDNVSNSDTSQFTVHPSTPVKATPCRVLNILQGGSCQKTSHKPFRLAQKESALDIWTFIDQPNTSLPEIEGIKYCKFCW